MTFGELEACAKKAFALNQDLAELKAIDKAIEQKGKALQAESAQIDALRRKININDRQAVAAFNARFKRNSAAIANYRAETEARTAAIAIYKQKETSSNILCTGRPYSNDDLAKVAEPWRSAMAERSKPVTIPTVGSALADAPPADRTDAFGIAAPGTGMGSAPTITPQKAQFAALLKAADAGNAVAQYDLAMRYQYGSGTDRDPDKALKYFLLSADQGNAKAAFAVSTILFDGQDVAADPQRALLYLRKSAAAGDHMAEHNLALWYQNKSRDRDRFEQAFAFMTKAASSGDAESQTILGEYYRDGVGTKRDPAKGFEWLGKAANQGYRPAQLDVADALQSGKGTERNPVEALKWYFLAAGMTKQDASRGCARLILESRVTRQRAEQAAKALQKELSAIEADKASADADAWVVAFRTKPLQGC